MCYKQSYQLYLITIHDETITFRWCLRVGIAFLFNKTTIAGTGHWVLLGTMYLLIVVLLTHYYYSTDLHTKQLLSILSTLISSVIGVLTFLATEIGINVLWS